MFTGNIISQIRTAPSNNYGSQSSFSNDFSGNSALTRSSSTYGGSSNDLLKSQINTGGFGGAGGLAAGSDRYFLFFLFLFDK
jgi:hypothetical protein